MVLYGNSSWNQTNLTNCKYQITPIPNLLNIMTFCTSPKSIRRSTWTATEEQAIFSQSSTAAPVTAAFEVWQPVEMFPLI